VGVGQMVCVVHIRAFVEHCVSAIVALELLLPRVSQSEEAVSERVSTKIGYQRTTRRVPMTNSGTPSQHGQGKYPQCEGTL